MLTAADPPPTRKPSWTVGPDCKIGLDCSGGLDCKRGLSAPMGSRLDKALSACCRLTWRACAGCVNRAGRGALTAALWAAFCCTALAQDEAGPAPREVYLIQNSGWMEPFYHDTSAPFLPLLRAFVQASALPDADVTIASFNQAGQLAGRPSPLPLYTGKLTAEALSGALARLDLPRRADGLYTDADYNGALSDTIPNLLGRAPGVIWMVTNNKNSRSNDQHVIENTTRFSTLLTASGFITQVVAYPLRIPARGQMFSEKGLVIYGIAYGQPAAAWLSRATQTPAMRSLLPAKPVRLKPLALDPVTLTLTGAGAGPWRLSRDGSAIVIDGVHGAAPASIDIPARLTSNYYPQVIDQAHLQAAWIQGPGAAGVAATITPDTITAMGPDETLDHVHVRLDVPAVARPPGLAGLLQGGTQLRGQLRLELTGVHLTLQPAFVAKMQDLFGSDAEAAGSQVTGGPRPDALPAALPAVFLGDQAVTQAATDVPVVINVSFSPLPLILALAGVAAAVLAAGGALLAGTRERTYSVAVGQETMRVAVRPFRSMTVRSQSGTRAVITGRLLGQPKIAILS